MSFGNPTAAQYVKVSGLGPGLARLLVLDAFSIMNLPRCIFASAVHQAVLHTFLVHL